MKTIKKIWIYPLKIMGLGLFLTGCCMVCREEDSRIADIDGNTYDTISIGTQVWFAENLKTTRYRNGDPIETTNPATLDISAESNPKYQWMYDDNANNTEKFGRLYTWHTVTDNRGICPTGWHVPNETDWTTLVTYLGGEDVVGGLLKETGTSHWLSPNTGATDSEGFTALPGGYRTDDGTYDRIGEGAFFWSTSEFVATFALYRNMWYEDATVVVGVTQKGCGLSVRCLKDY